MTPLNVQSEVVFSNIATVLYASILHFTSQVLDLVITLSSHTTIFGTLLQILSFFESGYSENTMPKTVTYEHINLTTLRTKCDITVSCSKIKQEH